MTPGKRESRTWNYNTTRRAAVVGAAVLAFACAVEPRAEAEAPESLCLRGSGPPTNLVDPVEDVGAFTSKAEAEHYYEEVVRDARHSREMQQKALDHLLADPRWVAADQREALSIAVKQTLEMIDGLEWREQYAVLQLNRIKRRG